MRDDKKLHPIAFYSRKFSIVKINYKIYDKEVLAIVDLFQKWHNFSKGASHQVTV